MAALHEEERETTTSNEAAPSTPPSSPPPTYDDAIGSPEPKYEEPLYTEIHIPLPPLPKPKAQAAPTGKRPKSHSIASLRPFHRRGSSSGSGRGAGAAGEEWPRIRKQVKSREVAAAMNLAGRHHRSSTIDALAVVPAVLVLSAELFTPGVEKSKGGKWEDGMI